MPEEIGTLWNVRKLLREGRVQEADDLITKDFAAQGLAEDKGDLQPPVKPPRTAMLITIDIFTALVGLHGNPSPLYELLNELQAIQQ